MRRLFLAASVLVLPASLWSQAAELAGLVKDPAGALVPNAALKIRNASTRSERTAVTNGSGAYFIPSLQPADYAIEVRKQGFKTLTLALRLEVGQRAQVDFSLEVGDTTQTVTVSDESAMLQTADPAVATVVDSQFVSNLPLNGRSLQTLINLAPGVVTTAMTSQNPGQFSVNGQRSNANYLTVDGVSANMGTNNFAGFSPAVSGSMPATNVQGSFVNLASVDALQEFKIQTSTFAPEFGRSPGAQISLVTKSGVNRPHGSAYEYFRNDKMDANDFFNNLNAIPKQQLRYNNFGSTFSGPVWVPKIYNGRNRTFFFFSYEAQRFELPQSAVLSVVPSLSARKAATTPYAVAVLNSFPLPNGADIVTPAGVATGGAYYTAAYSEPSRTTAASVRIDQRITDRFTLFGRYNESPSNSDSRNTRAMSTFNRIATDTRTLTLGATQVLSASMVNEARVNGSIHDGTTRMLFDGFGGGQNLPETFLFPPNMLDAPRRGIITLSGLSLVNGQPFTSTSLGTDELFRQRQINVVDSFAWTRGKHQLKFGVDYRWLSPVIAPAGFVDNATFANLAAVYNNMATSVLSSKGVGYTLQFPVYSLYAQDTWRVGPRLTLTFGTRWEISSAPTARGGKQIQTVEGVPALTAVDFSSLQLAPAGTPVFPTSFRNFAPRLGVAYQLVRTPGRELLIRGGGGIFYDLGTTGFGSIGFPYSSSRTTTNVPLPLDASIGAFPPPNATPSPTNRPTITIAAPGYHLPRVYQWNITMEQSLGPSQVLSAAYVAAIGHGLVRQSAISFLTAADPTNPNKPFSPNFGGLTVLDNATNSSYQSLQTQFKRRLTQELQVLASYTWSHSLDSGSEDLLRAFPERLANTNLDKSSSEYDVRHAASVATTWNLPAPKAGALAAVARNWSVNNIFFARTATPMDITAESTQGATLFGSNFTRRPNVVPGVPFWIDDPAAPGGKRINFAAFSYPYPSQLQGFLGRNVLRGFGAWQADIGIHREFRAGEHSNIQFRAELFNIFNHANFANPNSPFPATLAWPALTAGTISVDSPVLRSTQMLGRGLGGGSNSGGYNPIFQIGGPRNVQLALRYSF